MKSLIVISLFISFIAYSQSIEIKKDKNDRKFIVEKNSSGEIVSVTPSSGIDYQSSGIDYQSDSDAGNSSGYSLNKTSSFTWDLKFTAPDMVFIDISFANPLVGYIVSELGRVHKTTDGGNTWTLIMDLGFPYYWYGVDAITPDTLIISGFNNQASIESGVVRWSYDGGNTWTNDIVLNIPSSGVGWLYQVHFWNKNVGVVANAWGGGMYWTTNGGTDWTSWHFVLVDPDRGWFFGHLDTDTSGNIWTAGISQGHSSDFGQTWTTYPHVDETFDGGVDFVDNITTGLTGGGSISPNSLGWMHKTTNGGATWGPRISTFPYPIRSVKVFSDSIFLAVGGRISGNVGGIYSSTDAGNNWNLDQITGAEMFTYTLSYPSPDSTSIWCVGSSGQFIGKLYKTSVHNSSLPVELTSFTAEANDGVVELKWRTATETNNQGFEIQRKESEVESKKSEWEKMGYVAGYGTTTEPRAYSYVDNNITTGKYFYRLRQIDFNGSFEYSDVVEVDILSIDEYALEQNFPNPFNPATTIGYVLREKTTAKLILLNAIGEEVAVLVNEEQDKGFHKVDFNAVNLPSGVYFYQLRAGDYTSVKKMILLK